MNNTESVSNNISNENPKIRLQLQTVPKPVQLARLCPVNGSKGKSVPGQTVKALLKVSLRLVKDDQYYFCPDPDCPVVYFTNSNESGDVKQTFTKDQVREAVFQKEPTNPLVEVCYCFSYNLGTIQLATTLRQKEMILADIREGIARGQCACDLRNPQGACCLGNITRLLK